MDLASACNLSCKLVEPFSRSYSVSVLKESSCSAFASSLTRFLLLLFASILRQDSQLHSDSCDSLNFLQLFNILFLELGGIGLEPGCGQ